MERHAPGADKAVNVSANLLLAAPSAALISASSAGCCTWCALLMTMLAVLQGHWEPAFAEQSCAGSFSDVSWREGVSVTDDGVAAFGGAATVVFHWSVKEGSRAGDYFTLQIPEPIRRERTLAPFWLDSPTGEHIARVTWDGQTTRVHVDGLRRDPQQCLRGCELRRRLAGRDPPR